MVDDEGTLTAPSQDRRLNVRERGFMEINIGIRIELRFESEECVLCGVVLCCVCVWGSVYLFFKERVEKTETAFEKCEVK